MPCLGHLGRVVRRGRAAAEDAAVDLRVQRLDPAAEDLGVPGDLVDRAPRRCPSARSALGRAAGGDDRRRRARPAPRANSSSPVLSETETQRARDLHSSSPGATGPGDDPPGSRRTLPAANRRTASGTRRCSTSRIRAVSASASSPYSTGTASCRMGGPPSTTSSAKCTVTPVTRTPQASACSIACSPGKAGSSDGWRLMTRSGKRSRKRAGEDAHPAGEHHEAGIARAPRRRPAPRSRSSRSRPARRDDRGRDAGALGALQAEGAGLRAHHQHDLDRRRRAAWTESIRLWRFVPAARDQHRPRGRARSPQPRRTPGGPATHPPDLAGRRRGTASAAAPDVGRATTTHMPRPMLNVRHASSSATRPVAMHGVDRRPGAPTTRAVEDAPQARGQRARQVLGDAAARDVGGRAHRDAGRPRARASSPHVEAGGREQQVGVGRERPVGDERAHQREAVRVEPGGGDPDDDVALAHAVGAEHLGALHHPAGEAGQVEVARRVEPGHLGRLAAGERAAHGGARLGDRAHQDRRLDRGRGGPRPGSRGTPAGAPRCRPGR